MLYYCHRNAIVVTGTQALIPAPVLAAGQNATRRFLEFFTAQHPQSQHPGCLRPAVSSFFARCERTELGELKGATIYN
jgi:hypothetical protein